LAILTPKNRLYDKTVRRQKKLPYNDPYCLFSIKINTKCIKDLNVRGKALKLLEKKYSKHFNTDTCSDFLARTPGNKGKN
jgi:hypothetical protein